MSINFGVWDLLFEQGTCGACWAFVSAVAAEIAIKLSMSVIISFVRFLIFFENNIDAIELNAVKKSNESFSHIPSLSSQELIDCDVELNQGCSGGNPYNAFEYILDHGLVSWSDYPYAEKVPLALLMSDQR